MIIVYKSPDEYKDKVKLLRLVKAVGGKPYRLSFIWMQDGDGVEEIKKLIKEFGGKIISISKEVQIS
jgi:hypothetical protein